MKIMVVGLWHLGCVIGACLAKVGHEVIAYDPHDSTIANLQQGNLPIFEPGLEALIRDTQAAGQLIFTNAIHDLSSVNLIWVTFDTPVDDDDVADVDFVTRKIEALFPYLQDKSLVIISSQIPVGTTNQLQKKGDQFYPEKKITFAYIPENLRLEKAIAVFTQPDRMVIGLDNHHYKVQIQTLLQPFTTHLIWMSVVSAEMTKHAINAFLAVSVTFINELSVLCEVVGANAREVERGLKSEERIGPKAYLRPGDAIAGGTLMRDINYLTTLGKERERRTFLLSAISDSNHYHKQWLHRKLVSVFTDLHNKQIAVLGLTYKAGTDTLRRSMAIEICEWLYQQGSQVRAYDPVIHQLPEQYAQFIQLTSSVKEAIQAADAVIISTAWSEFCGLSVEDLVSHLKQPYVLDPSGFIAKNIQYDTRIKYFSVGVPG
ncbi:MAG TPA: nucleotide sugar dehydrogenase [Gammaproteobacteria bacterium]|nr:nucleotide sugar dehydrogenase [Gammaproteobacteria bacterium]